MKERKSQHFNIGVKMIKVLKLKNKQLQVVDKHVEHIREHLSHFHEVWHQTTATITHSPSVHIVLDLVYEYTELLTQQDVT